MSALVARHDRRLGPQRHAGSSTEPSSSRTVLANATFGQPARVSIAHARSIAIGPIVTGTDHGLVPTREHVSFSIANMQGRPQALACLALMMTACQSGNADEPPTSSSSAGVSSIAVATDANALVGRRQGHSLEMATGRSVVRFPITALPPPRHTFAVYVEAPRLADVGVSIRTWYGQRLRVLGSTQHDESCTVQDHRSVCSLAFPRLEAQRPGEWTVIVVKRSKPAAQVRVEVTFNAE
jgi:hypothetical protein